MDPEEAGRLSQVTLRSGQGSSDEAALDLAFRVVVEDALREHFVNQAVELLPQACRPLSCPKFQGITKLPRVRCRPGGDRLRDTFAESGRRRQVAIRGREVGGSI